MLYVSRVNWVCIIVNYEFAVIGNLQLPAAVYSSSYLLKWEFSDEFTREKGEFPNKFTGKQIRIFMNSPAGNWNLKAKCEDSPAWIHISRFVHSCSHLWIHSVSGMTVAQIILGYTLFHISSGATCLGSFWLQYNQYTDVNLSWLLSILIWN